MQRASRTTKSRSKRSFKSLGTTASVQRCQTWRCKPKRMRRFFVPVKYAWVDLLMFFIYPKYFFFVWPEDIHFPPQVAAHFSVEIATCVACTLGTTKVVVYRFCSLRVPAFCFDPTTGVDTTFRWGKNEIFGRIFTCYDYTNVVMFKTKFSQIVYAFCAHI